MNTRTRTIEEHELEYDLHSVFMGNLRLHLHSDSNLEQVTPLRL